jgi:hypothetical protein
VSRFWVYHWHGNRLFLDADPQDEGFDSGLTEFTQEISADPTRPHALRPNMYCVVWRAVKPSEPCQPPLP